MESAGARVVSGDVACGILSFSKDYLPGRDTREELPRHQAAHSEAMTESIMIYHISSLVNFSGDDQKQCAGDENKALSLRSGLLMIIEIAVLLILIWHLLNKW
jgi:hypothetical protein